MGDREVAELDVDDIDLIFHLLEADFAVDIENPPEFGRLRFTIAKLKSLRDSLGAGITA